MTASPDAEQQAVDDACRNDPLRRRRWTSVWLNRTRAVPQTDACCGKLVTTEIFFAARIRSWLRIEFRDRRRHFGRDASLKAASLRLGGLPTGASRCEFADRHRRDRRKSVRVVASFEDQPCHLVGVGRHDLFGEKSVQRNIGQKPYRAATRSASVATRPARQACQLPGSELARPSQAACADR